MDRRRETGNKYLIIYNYIYCACYIVLLALLYLLFILGRYISSTYSTIKTSGRWKVRTSEIWKNVCHVQYSMSCMHS